MNCCTGAMYRRSLLVTEIMSCLQPRYCQAAAIAAQPYMVVYSTHQHVSKQVVSVRWNSALRFLYCDTCHTKCCANCACCNACSQTTLGTASNRQYSCVWPQLQCQLGVVQCKPSTCHVLSGLLPDAAGLPQSLVGTSLKPL